jgi:aryl-alcohol dehydrogenase-like predicted oxidoreductase
MQYRVLGGTGVRVSTHCLGTMMFGPWGNTDVDECVRIIHAAIDAGINFVDTADVYSEGASEEIVGKALRGRRDEVVLATKVHGSMGPGIACGSRVRWRRVSAVSGSTTSTCTRSIGRSSGPTSRRPSAR